MKNRPHASSTEVTYQSILRVDLSGDRGERRPPREITHDRWTDIDGALAAHDRKAVGAANQRGYRRRACELEYWSIAVDIDLNSSFTALAQRGFPIFECFASISPLLIFSRPSPFSGD